jgi:Protein of unknown function (DUF1559)
MKLNAIFTIGSLQHLTFSAVLLVYFAGVPTSGVAQKANALQTQRKRVNESGKSALEKRWNSLSKKQAAATARRHLHGLVRAAHRYHAAHGSLPPAVVPNRKLPGGKRLSGLVLLLPYFGAKSWIEKDKPCFTKEEVKFARDLYKSIDLTKAWDDPKNLKAAKTIVPAFLAPQSGMHRDENGYAVSHFAFVQGSEKGLDGAFPGDKGVKFSEIKDGTVQTLAIGQIANDLGPWLAEGLSTARQFFPPTKKHSGSFGSK